jgi:hypothetical protein
VSGSTSCAPLSPELRGVAISLLVPLFEPNFPTSATRVYVGSSRSAHCATQAKRNDAVQTYGGWPKCHRPRGVCACSLFVAAGNDPKLIGVDASGRDDPDGH